MAQNTSIPASDKVEKPSPDFPLTAHSTGRWCKKIAGKTVYFGPIGEPEKALKRYQDFLAGKAPAPKRKRRRQRKPEQPEGCPLFAHKSGRWAKKVLGKTHYFGPWEDLDGALEKWNKEKDHLLQGRRPPIFEGRLTTVELCNRFLSSKRQLVEAGELSTRHWEDLYRVCQRVLRVLGKDIAVEDLVPADFDRLHGDMAKKHGAYARVAEVARARSIFKYAFDSCLIDRPVRFGTMLKRPSAKTLRQARAKSGPKLFTADEVKALLAVAKPALKAMVLLALNAGYGNTDIGKVTRSAIDLEAGWATFPRSKTGAPRRAKLWAQTVEALKEWQAIRPEPNDPADSDLVFITARGRSWVREPVIDESRPLGTRPAWDGVQQEFRKAMKACNIKKPGVSFYSLRRVYRTVADGCLDHAAIDLTMGHQRQDDMAAVYRQGLDDSRLEKVAEHVRMSLFGAETKPKAKAAAKPKTRLKIHREATA